MCDNVKDRIKAKKDEKELDAKILTRISKYDFREAYQDVLMKTGVHLRYNDRCAWVINDEPFNNWAISGKDAILLLEGSKGTGKTTVMARAISEILHSDEIQFQGKKFAMFFFQKIEVDSSFLTAKGCLQSLVRQLSWDHATASIEKATEEKHEMLTKQLRGEINWATEDCMELLKMLIPGNETYVMIDGIDECTNSVELLERLSDLILSLKDVVGDRQPLHLMLCGKRDLKISDYFTNFKSISTTPATSRDDQGHYVKTEIAHRRKLKPGSLFFKSPDYTNRLECLLLEQGNGLFRWIEMIIDVCEKRRFENSDDIEDLFNDLLQPADRQEMNDEYARLLNTLGQKNQTRVIKMLKLLACQKDPPEFTVFAVIFTVGVTLSDLAEAINASDNLDDHTRLTEEDVSSILAGFVRVDPGFRKRVRIAHGTVIDYLTGNSAPEGDFSVEGMHSEAVRLCLSSIYQRPSGFFRYSCRSWPYHCRIAISQIQSPAAQDLKQPMKAFFFSDTWRTWLEALPIRGSHLRHTEKNPQRKTALFIVKFDLIGLLDPCFDNERPYIRDLIDISHIHIALQPIFRVELGSIKAIPGRRQAPAVQKLLELFPEQLRSVDTRKCLVAACFAQELELVHTFLKLGASIFTWYRDSPVFHIYSHRLTTLSERVRLSRKLWVRLMPLYRVTKGRGLTLCRIFSYRMVFLYCRVFVYSTLLN